MNMDKIIMKRENEKLLKLFISVSGKIDEITITGDFFAYPENCITDLEDNLIDAKKNEFESIIDNELSDENLFGISKNTLKIAISKAWT